MSQFIFKTIVLGTLPDNNLYELLSAKIKTHRDFTRFIIGVECLLYKQQINHYSINQELEILSNRKQFENFRNKYYKGADAAVIYVDLENGASLDFLNLLHYEVQSQMPVLPVIFVGFFQNESRRQLSFDDLMNMAKDLLILDYIELDQNQSNFLHPYELLSYVLVCNELEIDAKWEIEKGNFELFKSIVKNLI